MGVIFVEPQYPVVSKAPDFTETVTNFSSKDASLVLAATAASAPVGYLCGLATSTARPAMRAAALLGATAGFCLAYQRSAGRLMGYLPNDREVEKGLKR